jgi:uncharacterized membrane protein
VNGNQATKIWQINRKLKMEKKVFKKSIMTLLTFVSLRKVDQEQGINIIFNKAVRDPCSI